jgi:RNase_H superfamily
MKLRKAYFDIEATYTGPIKIEEDRNGFFKDYKNWSFLCEKDINEKKAKYRGIVGILTLDFDLDEHTNVHKITHKKIVQLVGEEITKERLMKELEGITDIIGYHCRTKPNWKGYTGYDFGVINAQFGVVLDDLPGVRCIDLELTAHSAGMYGGLKSIELLVPTVPKRKSGVEDGEAEEKLLWKIASCEDENKKKEAWKKALLYNREDIANLVYIEQYLRKIRMS